MTGLYQVLLDERSVHLIQVQWQEKLSLNIESCSSSLHKISEEGSVGNLKTKNSLDVSDEISDPGREKAEASRDS